MFTEPPVCPYGGFIFSSKNSYMPTKDQIADLVHLSKMAPEDVVLRLLRDTIEKYLADKSEENASKLNRLLIVAGLKLSTKNDSAEKVIEGIDQVHKFKQMFNASN
jgi:hypothetical protein